MLTEVFLWDSLQTFWGCRGIAPILLEKVRRHRGQSSAQIPTPFMFTLAHTLVLQSLNTETQIKILYLIKPRAREIHHWGLVWIANKAPWTSAFCSTRVWNPLTRGMLALSLTSALRQEDSQLYAHVCCTLRLWLKPVKVLGDGQWITCLSCKQVWGMEFRHVEPTPGNARP